MQARKKWTLNENDDDDDDVNDITVLYCTVTDITVLYLVVEIRKKK